MAPPRRLSCVHRDLASGPMSTRTFTRALLLVIRVPLMTRFRMLTTLKPLLTPLGMTCSRLTPQTRRHQLPRWVDPADELRNSVS